MSGCDIYCEGTEEGHGHLIVTRPKFVRFVAFVRRRGFRKFELVGASRSRRKAYRMLADAMQNSDYKRGVVTGNEGRMSYYGPTVLIEMTN